MFRTGGVFDKLLDKATSNMLLEPDWPSILQICDLIRQNDVTPKHALSAIKKKLFSPHPHTALYALQLLESMVKNCGAAVHDELTTKVNCEMLHELANTTQHEDVRQKLLELIQTWTFAFRKNIKYSALKDTMALMKAEGYKFPALRETDAMFSADSAPEWLDGSVCHRCRTQFALLVRKHHCRACGQVFCSSCTTKSCTLPKYGIEKEVRVCDSCYEQVTKPSTAAKAAAEKSESELPPEYVNSSLAQQNQAPPRKTEAEIREEEELQLALALSQSEAEAKEQEKMRITSAYHSTFKEQKPAEKSPSPQPEPDNPELARYLNRSFWESRQIEVADSAARPTSPSAPATAPTQLAEPKLKENGVVNVELEVFVTTLKSQVEIFINRMKSNSSRGRSIATDSSVQTIFMNITAMHSKLLRYIQQHDDSRLHYERLQDKLTQVKDARAALDALREEHRERLRREAEEAERQRQMQMAHKLEIMRKKKQEYLQYQRQLALQRIQEQEREMQMRQEQQKQQYIMAPQYGSYMGSPVHGQQFPPPPNSAPGVGMYYQYGQPMMPGGQPIMQGPPQSAPQMGMGGPPQGLPPMTAPPGFPPGPAQQPQQLHQPGQPPQGVAPPMSLPQGPPGLPPQVGQVPPQPMGPQSIAPHQAPSQSIMGQPLPNQSLPPQQFQQPGAPPASPQIKAEQNGEAQTAELISFD